MLALVAILSGIVISGIGGVKSRDNFAGATRQLVTALRQARAEAFSRGDGVLFVVDTNGGRWWTIEDVGANFDLNAFDPANPTAAGDVLIANGTLPAGVSFGPAGGYGAALPQPFQLVPSYSGSSLAPAVPYCSFCTTSGAKTGWGFIRFVPGARVAYSGGPAAAPGQQLTMAGRGSGSIQQVLTVAVLTRTGGSATFETTQ